MEGNDDVLTTSNAESVKKVSDSDADFAFFLESPAAEYKVRKNSGLTTVGGLLNTNEHGIALPQGKRQKMRYLGSGATSIRGIILLHNLLHGFFIPITFISRIISVQQGCFISDPEKHRKFTQSKFNIFFLHKPYIGFYKGS